MSWVERGYGAKDGDLYSDIYPLNEVNIQNFINYLVDRGWKKLHPKDKEFDSYRSPLPDSNDKYIEILIPTQRDLADYTEIIGRAIKYVSAYEGRKFEEVLSQILIFGDLLKVQISSPGNKIGTIPIDSGIQFYSKIYDLLVYSACSEYEIGKKFFPKKLDRALHFIENCFIGQTQYGSFISKIHCELERESYQQDLESHQQLGRRVLLRILKGLENVSDAVKKGSPRPIIENYQEGLNANMCNALRGLIKIGSDDYINFSVFLEPKFPEVKDVPTKISLHPASERYLADAEDVLSEENTTINRELIGPVFQLRKEDETRREIRMKTMKDSTVITVRIELDEDSYQLAIDAHKRSDMIRIAGTLAKEGKSWYLYEPRGLKIIKNPTLEETFKKIKFREDGA